MEFKELLKHAKAYDKRAMMDIIEMYRPLLIIFHHGYRP